MDMRIRYPELLAEKGLTPYAVAHKSDDRISMSTAYRLARSGGQMEYFEGKILGALMDIFGVDFNSLLTRDDEPDYVPPKRSRKRKAG